MRYFIELSYNGKNYHGWQIQPDAISVQQKVNYALSTMLQYEISVVGAGRTDTGVHASQMFAHFDVDQKLDENVVFKLNSILPEDIVVRKVFSVDQEMHARFNALSRSYVYKICLGRDPFLLDFAWQIHSQKFDLNRMNEAAKLLLEYQDFESFSKVKTDAVCLLVSEETGEVSYIKDGEFELFKDYNELNQKMKKDLS
ncbi:hypothetical protein OAS45_03650 [Polaribacter sp.]|nr:hypothetical protein [Polaribacter sp.]